ncbi:MAG: hypothetical protein Q3971_04700 [Moraxella sp.]|nr:hypothetical protein [Moraxella sp.]
MKHLGCLLFLSPLFITACQEIDKNGELHATFKGNDVCLYIDDDNFKGNYELNIQILHEPKIWTYTSSYEVHYPNKENCIVINVTNFPYWNTLQLDTYYTISLWSKHKDFYGSHGGGFCVKQEKGITKLIEPKEVGCPKT